MVVQVCRMWREVSSKEIRKEVKEEFGLGLPNVENVERVVRRVTGIYVV